MFARFYQQKDDFVINKITFPSGKKVSKIHTQFTNISNNLKPH